MRSDDTLHVSQTGENWEVENETQTLAQAETKGEAIEFAKESAREHGIEHILVHSSDGRIEQDIKVA
jgi:hypothetical protein